MKKLLIILWAVSLLTVIFFIESMGFGQTFTMYIIEGSTYTKTWYKVFKDSVYTTSITEKDAQINYTKLTAVNMEELINKLIDYSPDLAGIKVKTTITGTILNNPLKYLPNTNDWLFMSTMTKTLSKTEDVIYILNKNINLSKQVFRIGGWTYQPNLGKIYMSGYFTDEKSVNDGMSIIMSTTITNGWIDK